MINLSVPYCKQINNSACGAACLEMIYKYYELNNISQEEIFNKYKKTDPHNTKGVNILTKDLVLDAQSRGFLSEIVRADFTDTKNSIALLKQFLIDDIPLIVCLQYSLKLPLLGHFRVVIGIDEKNIYFHDPDNTIENGESLNLSHKEFMKLWQPTGQNVTGGRFVWIKKQ